LHARAQHRASLPAAPPALRGRRHTPPHPHTHTRLRAPACTPQPASLLAALPSCPLASPSACPPRPAPPHMHTHMHTCTRLSAGRFVGGRYTPLPGGPGGAGDNAPSRPGTTVNSFCDAPHGLECGGLCWGSDVRARSVLHGGIMRLHSALHSHCWVHSIVPHALRERGAPETAPPLRLAP